MQCISLGIVCGLLVGSTSSQDVVTLLQQYCQEIIDKPIYLEGMPRTDALRRLEELGPNILSIMEDFIRREPDPHVREAMAGLFMRISGFNSYRYVGPASSTTDRRHPKETEIASLPVLSRDITRSYDAADMVNRLLSWWEQRDGFLKRNELCACLREITGSSVEEALNYDMERAAKLQKQFSVYGIYSLPYYITVIAEDNNPAVFMEFLARWRLFEEYRQPILLGTKGYERVKAVQGAYPTIDAKMAVVCTWWKEKKHTFTELADLYEAIDEVVGKYCPKD